MLAYKFITQTYYAQSKCAYYISTVGDTNLKLFQYYQFKNRLHLIILEKGFLYGYNFNK